MRRIIALCSFVSCVLCAPILSSLRADDGPPLPGPQVGTLYYDYAVQLEAAGGPIDLGSHAVTRLVDWNDDGSADLLVGGGDGYVWLFPNTGAPDSAVFAPGNRVRCGSSPVRAGTGFTSACFVDMDGDAIRDLVVGYGNRLRLYPNTGTAALPLFEYCLELEGVSGPEFLSPTCNGRIDAADWDGDGLTDIWSGDFDGSITFFRNDGMPGLPHFAAGERLCTWPHNTHPTIFDVNQDGRDDVCYGINWGYVGAYLNVGEPGAPAYGDHIRLLYRDGSELNIRALNGDDTTPAFADLNGDDIIDLVSGGYNGRVFVMYGVPFATILARAQEITAAHPADLGQALAADPGLRAELFGIHRGARHYVHSFLMSDPCRQPIHDWYLAHVAAFPQYFRKAYHDPVSEPYIPRLAGQVWVTLYESLTDSPQLRLEVSGAIDLTGIHRDLMLDHGLLFIENSRASAEQQRVVYEYLSSLPSGIWRVEVVQIGDFLGPGDGAAIEASSGVNIFPFEVGSWPENSFPPDSPPGWTDVYSICLAHEVNHNTLDTVGRTATPHLFQRKYEIIERASGPDIIFQDPVTNGVDWPATQARFIECGYWDGNPSTWSSAWSWFWSSGPGHPLQEHWLRNNLNLCVEAPQEAFATLANEYCTDSPLMLRLAKSRWDRGIRDCADEFVLFVEVYSQGGFTVPFYRIDTEGVITVTEARLHRDAAGHITWIVHGDLAYSLEMDAEGFVTGLEVTEASEVAMGVTPAAAPRLHGNFPDPFQTTTMIEFAAPGASPVDLRVYDVSGRLVRTLVSREARTEGTHRVEWNGRDDAGREASAGVYFLRLEAGGRRASDRVVRLRSESGRAR